VRGTATKIEVKRRGGVQARLARAGSLKPLQDFQYNPKLSKPALAPFFLTSYCPL